MQETNPTRKHQQGRDVNVLFQPESLRRRRVSRTPKGKMRCNFNSDFESENNTHAKAFYVNKISPTSKRNKPKNSESSSEGVNFERQNNNYIQFIKTATTQKNATPRTKITTRNLQIKQSTRKQKTNFVPLLNKKVNHKTHFQNIRKDERTHIDTLAMKEIAGTAKILQQNDPSSSKDQSAKQYQNKEANNKKFTERYSNKKQNSSDIREKACKNSYISYKQIFKETRELHRQKMANNISRPLGKGNIHVYATASKDMMIKQPKPYNKSIEQYKKTISENDLAQSQCVTLINSKSLYHNEGNFSNNDFVLDTERQELESKMDKIKSGKSKGFLDRCETAVQRKRRNNGGHSLRKCKSLTELINWIMDLDKQNLTFNKKAIDHNKHLNDTVVTRKPHIKAMYEKKLDSLKEVHLDTYTVPDIINYIKLKLKNYCDDAEEKFNVNQYTYNCNNNNNCMKFKSCDDLIESQERCNSNSCIDILRHIKLQCGDDCVESEEMLNADPCTRTMTDIINHIKLQCCDDCAEVEQTLDTDSCTCSTANEIDFKKIIGKKENNLNEELEKHIKETVEKHIKKAQEKQDLPKKEKKQKNTMKHQEIKEQQDALKQVKIKKQKYKTKLKIKKCDSQKQPKITKQRKEAKVTEEKQDVQKQIGILMSGGAINSRYVNTGSMITLKKFAINEDENSTSIDIRNYKNGHYVKPFANDSPINKNKKYNAKPQRGKSVTHDAREEDTIRNMEYLDEGQYVKPTAKFSIPKKGYKTNAKVQHANQVVTLDTGEKDTITNMEHLEEGQYVKSIVIGSFFS